MLAHPGRYYSLKNVSAKVSFEPSHPWRDEGFSRTLPPTFLFLQYSIVKEQTLSNAVSWACPLLASGPVECRLRGSLDFMNKGELFSRQRRAALVLEAVYTGDPRRCQQSFGSFLNFLRHPAPSPCSPCVRLGKSPETLFCRLVDKPY